MKRILLIMASLMFAAGMPVVSIAADVNVTGNVTPPPLPSQQEPPPAQPAPEAPPPLVFAEPPDVVVVPSGTRDVYLVPNTAGLYFYGGYWYRLHGGNWFRASLYSGPWAPIVMPRVPAAVVVIPPDYILALPPGYHRINYADFHSHWRDWRRTLHWQSHGWYRDHKTNYWGGKEFHKLPAGHPGDQGPRDRGPRVKGGGWLYDKGTGVKGDGKEPHDKGAGVKGGGSPYGKGPWVKGGGGPYDKSHGVKGDGGSYDKGPGVKGSGGPYDKGPGVKGGGSPYGKGPWVKGGDRRPGGGTPGGPGPAGESSGVMKPGGAEPKPDPPEKPE